MTRRTTRSHHGRSGSWPSRGAGTARLLGAATLSLTLGLGLGLGLAAGCGSGDRRTADSGEPPPAGAVMHDPLPEERHLRNIRQLTFEGENAEAYFSFDGKALILQSTHGDHGCDRIFVIELDGSGQRLVSTGTGRTTCAYFFPAGDRILYSSTHASDAACPPTPDHSHGYVWPIYDTYDIYTARPDGSDLRPLTRTPGYDAEATVGPDGTIVFTSVRDGDLEIYTMSPAGADVKRLTHAVGYDGGAFFSPDGSKIVYRGHHPQAADEIADYQALLAAGLIRPGKLEVFVMDADGGNQRQITSNDAANFCPFFHPSGERIIFASNVNDPQGRNFDLYLVGVDGTGIERVTYDETFDAFPMFSPDGRYLVWCSNRATPPGSHDTHVFIAEWIEDPGAGGS